MLHQGDQQDDRIGEEARFFADLYDRLYRYFYAKVGDPELAEELTSRTLFRLAKKYSQDRFQGVENRKAFAIGVARHVWLEWLREKSHGRTLSGRDWAETLGDDSPSVSEAMEADEERERVRAAVELLPEIWRPLVKLFYYEGKTGPEIAEALHIPPGTVKSRLNAARRQLGESL